MRGSLIARSKAFWSVRGIIVVAIGLVCVLVLITLAHLSMSGGPSLGAHCDAIAAELDSKADAAILQKACADLTSRYAGTVSQQITIDDLPTALRDIAANLGLSEARLEGKV